MSQENVEIFHRAIDAFNRRDMRALAELSHEDLEFVSVLTAVDAGGASYHGSEAWASYFAVMNETWEDWHTEPASGIAGTGVQSEDFRVFDAGADRVACVFRLVGKGKHSGAAVEREVGLACRIREGKLWRMRSYLDPSEALKAVGLRE
jgi:ketosteroid isomerase-like protein